MLLLLVSVLGKYCHKKSEEIDDKIEKICLPRVSRNKRNKEKKVKRM